MNRVWTACVATFVNMAISLRLWPYEVRAIAGSMSAFIILFVSTVLSFALFTPVRFLTYSRSAQKLEPFRFLFHPLLLNILLYRKPMNVLWCSLYMMVFCRVLKPTAKVLTVSCRVCGNSRSAITSSPAFHLPFAASSTTFALVRLLLMTIPRLLFMRLTWCFLFLAVPFAQDSLTLRCVFAVRISFLSELATLASPPRVAFRFWRASRMWTTSIDRFLRIITLDFACPFLFGRVFVGYHSGCERKRCVGR